MWTPRRILLLVGTTLLTVGAYLGYSALLGGIDGLPELPADYAKNSDAPPPPPPPEKGVLTKQMLKLAFGPASPEVVNAIAYKLQIYQADRGVLLASGQPVFAPAEQPSNLVEVSPFSIGFLGKAPGVGDTTFPGQIEEITTAHADRAILEFDKPVANVQDMREKCKLIGFRLISAPEIPSTDTRRGKVWVTNNQKSPDPGQFLVFNTVGPVYYKAPDEDAPPNPDVPQLYTNAEVEVIDKRNLPRALRSTSTATTAATADTLRDPNTIAAILTGKANPPATMTGEGLKIYLTSSKDPAAKPQKRNSTGYSGVRLIELSRDVRFRLWTDGGTGFPGSNPAPAGGTAPKPPATDPPAAFGAIAGGLPDATAVAAKFRDKRLLIIDTPGYFRFDFTTNLARFESEGFESGAAPRTILLHRANATSDSDDLFCSLLQIQFEPPTDVKAKPATPAVQASAGSGLKVQSMTATGLHVFVQVVDEQLQANGTELKYVVDAAKRATVTTLRGPTVAANRQGNTLEAGTNAAAPGEIIITSLDPTPGTKETKATNLRVNGPGKIDILDGATGAKSVQAVWGKFLTQERVRVGDQDMDLLKFDGDAKFIDVKAAMQLSATRLLLWLGSRAGEPARSGNQTQAVPQRLDAIGNVASTSPDLHIKDSDYLKLWFRDIATPAAVATAAAKPAPAAPAPLSPAAPGAVAAAPVAPAEPAKPKPPIVLSARTIESWLVRYPQPAGPGAPAPAGKPGLKYELERAYCEDRVVVHQDPADATKRRGLDIAGVKLNLVSARVNDELGQVMTVTGMPGAFAEVHFETTSLFGPVIKIDQLSNTVAIDGVGSLLMPSDTDFAGAPTDRANEMEIRFVKSMFFNGAKGTAEFLGLVNAVQRPARDALKPRSTTVPVAAKSPDGDGAWSQSRLLCHRLDVTFDRPIYFNQFKRDGTGPKREPGDSPKLRRADCLPMPDDELAADAGESARTVSYFDETYTSKNQLLKAQLIEGRQIEVRLRDKSQELFAAGPGQVRILQPDGGEAQRTPGQPAPPPRKPGEQAPFKLTLVKYRDAMTAIDKNKVFQAATFRNGADVWQIPTNNINLNFAAHLAPPGTTEIKCSTSLEVSTSRPSPEAPAEQEMVAVGNAEFSNDDYTGNGARVTYKAKDILLEGTAERMASLYSRKRSLDSQKETHAEKIIYRRDGTVQGDRAGTGVYIP